MITVVVVVVLISVSVVVVLVIIVVVIVVVVNTCPAALIFAFFTASILACSPAYPLRPSIAPPLFS